VLILLRDDAWSHGREAFGVGLFGRRLITCGDGDDGTRPLIDADGGDRNLLAILGSLQTVHDEAVAICNPVIDKPVVADIAIHIDHAFLDLAVRIDEFCDGLAASIARDGPLRQEEAVFPETFLDQRAAYMPGIRSWSWLGKIALIDTVPAVVDTEESENSSLPGLG
jgi:hypothetical protein